MAYTPYEDLTPAIRYSLAAAPEARTDGSGCVAHDIWSMVDVGGWINDAHWTINIPATELEAVLVMANNAAKIAAYKALLVSSRNVQPSPNTGNDTADILARINANGRAALAAAGADEYITVTLGQEYPVAFAL